MKTNLDGIYKSNPKLEAEGKWFDISKEAKIKLKRFGGANNHEIKALNAKFLKPYASQIKKGILPEEVETAVYVKVFVKACVTDWSGITDSEGQEIPFSEENAVRLLKELPELMEDLVVVASDFEAFKEEVEELGNS